MEANNSEIEGKNIKTINSAKKSETQDDEINFKNSARSQSSNTTLKQSKDPRFIVITEPHFMIIRKIFSIDQSEYTEFELKKKLSFINNFNIDKNLLKKIDNLNLRSFFETFLLGNYQKTFRFLNFHLYDIDRAMNNIYKFLEFVKKLKFNELELLQIINKLDDKESSSILNYLSNISSLYTYALDNLNQPIIAFDVPLLLLEKEKFINKSYKDNFKSLLMKFNQIYLKEFKPGQIEQINLFIDLGDISSKDLICIENFAELLKLFQLLFPSVINKIFLSLSTTSKEALNLIQNNVFQFYKDKLIAFDCTFNFKKIFEKYTKDISYETFFNFFINKSGRKNSNNIFSENSLIEIKQELDKVDKEENCLNLEIENEFYKETEKQQEKINTYQDNFTRNKSSIKHMNTERIFSKYNCKAINKNMINNLETDSYTKDLLEAYDVNSNFTNTQSLAHAQSYRSYRNMNNSSWLCKSLSIESCNKFSINDFYQKRQKNKLSITSTNNFTIIETPSFTFEKIQMSKARRRPPVIFEKKENEACCGNSNDECIIF
jgi:hypothetical protein